MHDDECLASEPGRFKRRQYKSFRNNQVWYQEKYPHKG